MAALSPYISNVFLSLHEFAMLLLQIQVWRVQIFFFVHWLLLWISKFITMKFFQQWTKLKIKK